MYCRNCGNLMDNMAVVCVRCGVPAGRGINYCPNCGNQTNANSPICSSCGIALAQPIRVDQKSKVAAGLLGLFLGSFGAHNFYLGYTRKAVVQLVCTIIGLVLCCVGIGVFIVGGIGIWAFVESIMIFAGSIRVDGKGVPLKE